MKSKVLLLSLNMVLAVLFTGCLGGRTRPAQYYRLASEASPVKDAVQLPPVLHLRIELPDYLRRQEIVETDGRNLMYLKEDARWGHVLAEGIRDSLTYRLGLLNDGKACRRLPGKQPEAMQLEFRFWKFSGDRRGGLQVQGMGKIHFLPAGESTSFRIDFAVPYQVGSTESLVLAHDQAVARLTEETAEQIRTWLGRTR